MEYYSRKLLSSTTRERRHSTTNPGDDSRSLEYNNLELLNDMCNLTYLLEYDSKKNNVEERCIKPIYANDFNFALLFIFINYFINYLLIK